MYVIETLLPDGPHWYAGIRVVNPKVTGPEWSPYFTDRKEFSDKTLAENILLTVCKEMDGAKVVMLKDAMKIDSRWEHDGNYFMRAKYLTPGMEISVANVEGTFEVKKVNKGGILLMQNGKKFPLPPKSNIWVKIVTRKNIIKNNWNETDSTNEQ